MEFKSSGDTQQLLDHLQKTPEITQLDIQEFAWRGMTDIDGQKIGEAVASLKSLESLVLILNTTHDDEYKSSPESLWPMDALLTGAFLGEKRNTSVRSLNIRGSGTDGELMRLGVLPEVIEQGALKELVFELSWGDWFPGKRMHLLLDALLENSSIESLSLPRLDTYGELIPGEIFVKIVDLVKKTTSIQKLELYLGEIHFGELGDYECSDADTGSDADADRDAAADGDADEDADEAADGDEDADKDKDSDAVNLDAFYGASSSNTSIRCLTLKGLFYTPIAETQFSTWIQKTSTLQELVLEGDGDESEVPKILFRALGENKSLTKLKIDDFEIEDEAAEELLKALKVNSTLQEFTRDSRYRGFHREEEVQEALAKNRTRYLGWFGFK